MNPIFFWLSKDQYGWQDQVSSEPAKKGLVLSLGTLVLDL